MSKGYLRNSRGSFLTIWFEKCSWHLLAQTLPTERREIGRVLSFSDDDKKVREKGAKRCFWQEKRGVLRGKTGNRESETRTNKDEREREMVMGIRGGNQIREEPKKG